MRRTFLYVALIVLAAVASGTYAVAPVSLSFGSVGVRTQSTEATTTVSAVHPRAVHFVGDLFLGRRVETYMDRYGADFPYRRLSWSTTTPVVANFEAASPLLHQHTPDLTFRFSVDQQYLTALAAAGVTHAGLANNHAYDAGLAGFRETRTALAGAGIVPFGDHRITDESYTTITLASGTVAVVGVYAVDTNPDLVSLGELVRRLEGETVLQVAYMHWGAEYTNRRTESTAALAARLAALGFDVIIGHHPHVVQDIELVGGVPVIYSLGNFIFDQYFSVPVQDGLGVTLAITAGSYTLDLVPYTSRDARSQPRAMDEGERALFLADLAEKSDPLLGDAIRSGTLTFPCASCNYQGID